MSTGSIEQNPEPNRPKLWIIPVCVVALVAVSFTIFAGVTALKRRAFVAMACSACSEVARVDAGFQQLMESPAPPRDQVLKQSADAVARIDGLETSLYTASAPGDLRTVQATLCQALGQHKSVYEAISSQTEGAADLNDVRQAMESASALYLLVDSQKVPTVTGLPALKADRVAMGLRNVTNAPLIEARKPEPPEPEPSSTSAAKPPAPVPAPTAKPTAPPAAQTVAVKPQPTATVVSRPASPPRVVKAVSVRRSVVKKQRNAKQQTGTFRCPYRGCNAWFTKASLLQKHKKYCIYRPGGIAARFRRR